MGATHGVSIITPIFAETIFIAMLVYLAFWSPYFVNSTYLTTQVACPVVNQARTLMSWIDANLFQYYKSSLTTICETEDSFQRFIFDAWVRTIVTSTDSTLLVFQTLPQAIAFDFVLMYTVVPIFAVMYAFVFNLVSLLEDKLPRTEFMEKLEDVVGHFDFLANAGSGDWSSVPPRTKPRRRPDTHRLEGFLYWKNKKLRVFKYYKDDTTDTLRWVIWYLLIWILGFRLSCLWFGLDRPARWLANRLAPQTLALHKTWFASASNMLVTETRLLHLFHRISAFGYQLSGATPTSFLVLYMCGFILFLYVCHRLLMQQRKATKTWLDQDRTDEQKEEEPAKKRKGTCEYALELGQKQKLQKI